MKRVTPAELSEAIGTFEGNTDKVAQYFGVSRRSIQRWQKLMQRNDDSALPLTSGHLPAPDKLRAQLIGSRFVFTSAQNNTDVHEKFLKALVHFCDLNGARLCIGKFTYNKSGFQNLGSRREELYYDPMLEPYFIEGTYEIAPDLVFYDMNILPTAVRPLSGLSTITREASGIFPHAKLALESVPTSKDEDWCKMLYTTGAVTMRNYIEQKAGQKANFHHVFGALYVEVAVDGRWFVRQLVAGEDGSFYDLSSKYTEGGQQGHQHCPACVVLGDLHAPNEDQTAFATTLDMLECLHPENAVVHDALDFYIGSPHRAKSAYEMAINAFEAQSIEDEVLVAGNLLEQIALSTQGQVHIAPSNHVQHMQQWLANADYKSDPLNAEYFLGLQQQMYRLMRKGRSADEAFWQIFKDEIHRGVSVDGTKFNVLQPDDSMSIKGIEVGWHGHYGPCGARGNVANLSRINTKVIIGHTHSARIMDGAYSAGTLSKMDMGYNKGPSNWSHSHVLIYPNGKRAIITVKGNKWRA